MTTTLTPYGVMSACSPRLRKSPDASSSRAAQYDTAPGATIVLVAIGIFAVVAAAGAVRRGTRRRATISSPAGADVEPPDVVLGP